MPSDLQKDYRDYFMEKMEKHDLNGLGGLTEEKLKKFFNDVARGWEEGKGRTSNDVPSRLEHLAFRLKSALSPLQEEYRDYFMGLMEKHDITALGNLDEEKIRAFFNDVSNGWTKGKGPKKSSEDAPKRLAKVAGEILLVVPEGAAADLAGILNELGIGLSGHGPGTGRGMGVGPNTFCPHNQNYECPTKG